jgi:hypothetical protein
MELQNVYSDHVLGMDSIDKLIEQYNMEFMKHNIGDYSFIESKNNVNKPETTLGEPCMVNPCSYTSVEKYFIICVVSCLFV